ncbi:SCO0607 family lipoprotein [Streptomyces sp. NPDC020681]|uniref:SCO0607 family lipoprotein n=1 Tax=Streptomyces sp. NPDC020681 TaxID=3365083 RepID=UPI0037B8D284
MRKFAPIHAAAGMLTALLATGCSMQDAVCGGGEYPVKAVGNTTGRTCVPDGEEPPDGYVRYPEGKVPEHVDDKWDKYWSEVVVDENGDIVKD